MNADELIEKIVNIAVEHHVQPGDHAGESGHLAYVSFSISSVSKKQLEDNVFEINCLYNKHVVTEFTYEPYNPPYQYQYEKRIILYQCYSSDEEQIVNEINEDSFKELINKFIELYLLRIEQTYGDCRAPIKYPPYYHNFKKQLLCFIDLDLGENETIVFSANNAESMLHRMKAVFKVRFGFEKSLENQTE